MHAPRAPLVRLAFLASLGLAVAAPASGPSSRFRPLDPAREVQLPRDHGSHDDARVEWWYVTGHLEAAQGLRLGFQLTFFRVGIADEPAGTRTSAWAARDLHLAHFALADPAGGSFRYAERIHRTGPGAASARESHLDVANEGWRLVDVGGRFFVTARDAGTELTLLLDPRKPAVLHGDRGLSRKGPEPDAVSRYVSFTRLAATGHLVRDGASSAVSGSAWLDHEWGPGSIGRETSGWDWFALQLDDGRDLMLYQLRGTDGQPTRFSSGTLVERDGRSRPLGPSDFSLEVTARWRSPRSGGAYPARWTVRVPAAAIEADVVPILADQELVTDRSTRVTYWEGACDVARLASGRGSLGRAYVELTGYAGRGGLGVLSVREGRIGSDPVGPVPSSP